MHRADLIGRRPLHDELWLPLIVLMLLDAGCDEHGRDVGKEPVNDPPADTEPAYCRGLAVDDQGAIFVAVTGSRRVLKITPQGQVSAILESTSPWSPTGVALFGGDVYVLEWSEPAASKLEVREAWLPRVRKIAKDGTVSTLATISR